ncbi:YDG/SRA domain-containing protein [Rathayibacter sp. VKM Ac-2927]|uniref:YDG/SRA domain-containing protein n=1 Tax=Rathayibacter sp. VKM Ac-2927 TaxID=2929478 RepID=UPI001FB40154|nr:YDG/SRA domain-containing protein [Rathayibacter sp. VKM Ac-2927]MCJ1686765.1 YDG/SRA domain-containing protein [Rathayibacter sp. VKM Ac-2927]
MPDLTPATLSLELGVSQKRIRSVLREQFGTLDPSTTRWSLSEEQADFVRTRIARRGANGTRFTLVEGDQVLRRAVHRAYGGQQQGGIATPKSLGEIFIFTDPAKGARYGYDRFEGLREDGSYSYTGEGQIGDQVFLRGNLALRDAAVTNRVIRLFTVQGTSVTYIGAFTTGDPTYRYETIPDTEGTLRRGIIFTLVPISADVSTLPAYGGHEVTTAELAAWSPPEYSDVVIAGADLSPIEERVVSRVEFELQAAFGEWLTENGTPPSRLPLPVGATRIEPDLYVKSSGWIVEAKKSTARSYVRTAIGQVLDYAHVANRLGWAAVPVILLPGRPEADLVDLIRKLGIITAIRTDDGFVLVDP